MSFLKILRKKDFAILMYLNVTIAIKGLENLIIKGEIKS